MSLINLYKKVKKKSSPYINQIKADVSTSGEVVGPTPLKDKMKKYKPGMKFKKAKKKYPRGMTLADQIKRAYSGKSKKRVTKI